MKKTGEKILSGSRKIFLCYLGNVFIFECIRTANYCIRSGPGCSKEPLIGVSVQEKGTSNGAITDLDGNFTLNVKQNAILIFSYVGYKSQEVKGSPIDEDHTSGR